MSWWITTALLSRSGEKVLGPFVSRVLALEVRTLLERTSNGVTYWVDEDKATQALSSAKNFKPAKTDDAKVEDTK